MPVSPTTSGFCDAIGLNNDPCLRLTTANPVHERIRAYLLATLAVKQAAPAALDVAGLVRSAHALRSLPEIHNHQTATAASVSVSNILDDVRDCGAHEWVIEAVEGASEAAAAAAHEEQSAGTAAGTAISRAIRCGGDATLLVPLAIDAMLACASVRD